MGNNASANKSKLLVPEPFHEELASLRWKFANAEAKCLQLENAKNDLELELQICQDNVRSLHEQLYYPVQYNIGKLYMQGTRESFAKLMDMANGTNSPPEPLAHGYLAILCKKANQDMYLVQQHAEYSWEYVNQGISINNHHCQYLKGNFYYYGILKSPDVRKAMALWLLAANQGHVMAQFALASKYFIGITGVIENKTEAFRWFLKAANQGYAMAQFWVGNCYENGYGCIRNLEEAGKYYDYAANQGVTSLGSS